MNTDELRERLDALFPQLVDELSQLVAIPSVSSDPSHAADVVEYNSLMQVPLCQTSLVAY